MNGNDLIAVLEKLGDEINEVTDHTTNYGGCCAIAALVAKRLVARGVPAKGVVATYVGFSLDASRPESPGVARAWERNGVEFNHVGLEIEVAGTKYLFDSEGVVESDLTDHLPAGSWPVIDGYLSVDELHSLAFDPLNNRAWNPTFPKHKLPEIERLIDGALGTNPQPSLFSAEDEKLLAQLDYHQTELFAH